MSDLPSELSSTGSGPLPAQEWDTGLTDEDLLSLCAARDSRGLEALVRRYQAPLFPFLLAVMGSPDAAADAATLTFVRAWESAPAFRGRCAVSTWLYQLAVACAVPTRSSRQASAHAASSRGARELAAPAGHDLASALADLQTGDRVILALSYAANQSCEEMRRVVGGPLFMVRARLARARARLAEGLARA